MSPGPGLPSAGRDELEALLRLHPAPFMLVDTRSLRILAANAALTREIGYSEAELLGKKVSNFFSAQEANRLGKLLLEDRAAQAMLARSSWQLSRRDGSPIRYEVAPMGLRFAEHDAVLLYHPGQAPANVLEPNAPTADSGLSNTMAQFAFSAFHDLKEPLHFVGGYLRLLQERATSLDDESREFLQYAVQGTERIQSLVMGLLEFFRMGVQPLSPEPTALEQVLRETLQTLGLNVKDEGAIVTHDALPTLMLDRMQMIRLFQNLLSNAIKFRGPELPRIHVGARPESGAWHFWVQDNGIGIPPKDRERVFQPFQRLHSQDDYPGTGLGLSTCRRIVEAHGGRIWIEDNKGPGTVVHFVLPGR